MLNKLVSKIADTYAVYDLNKKRSSQLHFSYNCNQEIEFHIPDKEDTHPKVYDEIIEENKEFRTGLYKFKSLIKNEECNANVEIKYKRNVLDKNTKNIILIHGWKQESFKELNNIILSYLIDKNYNIYYYTLPFHNERNEPSSAYSGEFLITANIQRTVTSMNQCISDLKTLTNHIKSTSKGKIIPIGLSLGGYVSNLISVFDSNIGAVASLFYANNLGYLIFNTPIALDIKSELQNNNLTEHELIKLWQVIMPSMYKPIIPKENIFLVSGKYDMFIPITDSDILWHAWNYPQRILLNCGHSGIVLQKKIVGKKLISFIERI